MTLAQRVRLQVFLAEWKLVLGIAVVFCVVAFFITSVVVLIADAPPPDPGP